MQSNLKSQLRQHYRAIRANIPLSYRTEAAGFAAKQLTQNIFFKKSHHVACYLSTAEEFDSSLIIESIWQAKKHCYLPVATDDKSLLFVHYEYGDALHRNRYSILEPAKITETISPALLDIMIVPLVAFDLLGHRLGMGGGYYDRTLFETATKPKIFGLAYESQLAEKLPFDPWDVLLDGVMTEKKFFIFDKKSN